MEQSNNFSFAMSKVEIEKYLSELNEDLKIKNVKGEINLVGGAVMCLAFNSRESTHDIDAIFEPKMKIYESILNVSNKYNLPKDWINDSVKGFLSTNGNFTNYLALSHLIVNVAEPKYMLAMKCLSARMDNENEKSDIKFLIDYLELKTYEEIETVILMYYPENRFQAKTKYAIIELLEVILK